MERTKDGPAARVDRQRLESQLARVLASPVFAQAERQQRFLEFIVGETIAGHTDRLKGYTIGVEVFDRAADFDPAVDAIVRVEAARLRAKLREYYETDGRNDAIRFELPKGAYAISIVEQATPEPTTTHSGQESTDTAPARARPQPIEDKPSLAVLPFYNMSSDPEQDYFADGITEDLTTELSKLSGLFVVSRHSAFVYKGVSKRAEDISAELGVRYLLEGSVRRAAERMRISAQLIEANTGTHLWAERYDRDISDIFALQDDVTRCIVSVLQVKLTAAEQERMGRDDSVNLDAYDMLLRGMERYSIYTSESNQQARQFFQKAIEIHPGYAMAHARLAQTYQRDWAMSWGEREVLETGFEFAQKAVALDERLALGHAVLGMIQMWRRHAEPAIAAGRRAVGLDPNSAEARLWLSFILLATGYGEEALMHVRQAIRLDPHPSHLYLLALGTAHYVLGEYKESIDAHERGLELTPASTMNLRRLITMYALVGRDDDARRARERLTQLTSRVQTSDSFFIDEALARRYERDRQRAWDL